MFSPKPRYRFYGTPHNYLTAARHVVSSALSAATSDTDHVAMLEDRVASVVGVDHAIAVPQARFGIYLALRHMLKPGQRVLMSPYTIYDVVNMVLCAGGRPEFCDVDPATCNIDPAAVRARLEECGSGGRAQDSDRDDSIGAVMVTHLHGLACDIAPIAQLCAERGIPLIEDAAQAFGARVAGQHVGGIGDVGIYSFGRAKNINGFYGGMVVTRNHDLAAAVRAELAELPLEDSGKLAKRIAHCLVGDAMTVPAVFAPLTFRLFKLGAVNNVESVNKLVQTENDPILRDTVPESYWRRMTPLQARVIYDQIFTVDAQTEVRAAYARRYHDGLQGLRGLVLPPLRDDRSHIYLQYPILVQADNHGDGDGNRQGHGAMGVGDRWDFVRYMMKNGRDVAIQHMTTASELSIFSDHRRDCPRARAVADSCVLLPTYPGYGMDQVEANIAVMRRYFPPA